MEEREVEEQEEEEQQPAREPLLSKGTIIIVAVFVLLNLAIVFVLFGGEIFGGGGGGDGEGAAVAQSALDDIAIVDLGRIEVTKPLDPMQQNYARYSVSISLCIPAERQTELESKVRKFDAIFKEEARKAFLDTDAQELANQNLAGVRSSIKKRINDILGNEAVKEVHFPDFRPY